MARLERANVGVKVPCLTTWLHPNVVKKEKGLGFLPIPFLSGVDNGARTHDTRNHNPVLCQLSYTHHVCNETEMARLKGLEPLTHCLEGSCSIRLSYWRLYRCLPGVIGAGEGNRTLVPSLEGWYSTIELHPQALL